MRPLRWTTLSRLIFVSLVGLLLGLAGQGAQASGVGPAYGHRAVLVLVDGVNVSDLTRVRLPHLTRMMAREGAAALANVRSAGSYTSENGYVSLGAITRSLGDPAAALVFGVDEPYLREPAGRVLMRNTGYQPPAGSLVTLGLPQLQAANTQVDHPVIPGWFGESLKVRGKRVALIANADDSAEVSRLAGAVAMDRHGVIPDGDVASGLNLSDPTFPTGRRADYQRVMLAFRHLYQRNDVIVVDASDLTRIQRAAEWITPARAVAAKDEALQRLDYLFGLLDAAVDWKTTRLFVIAPSPSLDAANQGDCLTVALALGPGIHPGLLVSPTTRRPGLIVGSDIMVSALEWVGGQIDPQMAGRPVSSISAPKSLGTLAGMNRRYVATYLERPLVLKTYVVLQIISISAAIIALFQDSLRRVIGQTVRWTLLGLTAVPLILLVAPLLQVGNVLADIGLMLLMAVALLLVCRVALRSVHDSFLLVYLFTAATILADLLLGAPLGQDSILGYDPIGGARFYGIGNEYMGVLFGSAIMGLAGLLDRSPALGRYPRAILMVPLTLAVALAGAPQFGAKFGSLIAGMAILLTVWILTGRHRPRPVHFIWGTGLVAAVATAVAVLDALRPSGSASHFGMLVDQIAVHGPGALLDVAARKLAMNFRLMRYTVWSDAMVTFIVGLGVLLYRPVGLIKRVVQQNPRFTQGFWVALVGTLVVFFTNDAGVVAAATLMLFPTAMLLDLAIVCATAPAGDETPPGV